MTERVTLPDDQRVVVTAMETMTPLDDNLATSWPALIEGKHGIKPVRETMLRTYSHYRKLGAQVVATANYDPRQDPVVAKHRAALDYPSMHRSHVMAWRTMLSVLEQGGAIDKETGLLAGDIDGFDIGALVGSVFSGSDHVRKVKYSRVKPSDPFNYLFARVATAGAMHLNIRNIVAAMDTECASGAVTADMAAVLLRAKRAKMMLAGGADAPISPANIYSFLEGLKNAGTRTKDPEAASKPLDQSADGLVMGEGAGMMLLETWEDAQKRGITEDQVIAEMVGNYTLTHAETRTLAGQEGAVRVIKKVLEMAGVKQGETIYANGHLTGTGEDYREVLAYRQAINELRLDIEDFWLTSTKGATGHTMGAAGAIEAIFAILALRHNTIPPALKLVNPLPETEGFNLSPLVATDLSKIGKKVDVAASTSLGFGGTVTGFAFREFEA